MWPAKPDSFMWIMICSQQKHYSVHNCANFDQENSISDILLLQIISKKTIVDKDIHIALSLLAEKLGLNPCRKQKAKKLNVTENNGISVIPDGSSG